MQDHTIRHHPPEAAQTNVARGTADEILANIAGVPSVAEMRDLLQNSTVPKLLESLSQTDLKTVTDYYRAKYGSSIPPSATA